MFRTKFHAEIDTDNLTESFNHTLRTRYLHLQQDKTVAAFVKLLVDVVFTEHEREYAIATAQQTDSYRLPRYNLPKYLQNRPRPVQAACLLNLERGKEIDREDITEIQDGEFVVKMPLAKKCTVNIPDGKCSCYQFINKRHPCKHMFAVFSHFPQWSWASLPTSLTNSEYLTLDSVMLNSATLNSSTLYVTDENTTDGKQLSHNKLSVQ